MRAVPPNLAEVAKNVSDKIGHDVSASDITDIRNGLQTAESAMQSAISRALGKDVSYIEHLGELDSKLHNGGNRESIMFSAGVYFTSYSRNLDPSQLSANIVERGGLSHRLAKEAVRKMNNGERIDDITKSSIARAFNVPVSNLEWIGQRLFG